MRICLTPYCESPTYAREMCSVHYRRYRCGWVPPFEVPDAQGGQRAEPLVPVCECPNPKPQPITMFGWLTLADVHECKRCFRLVKQPNGDTLLV